MEAIDLGLSVLWADMNVGAHSPAEAGDYFAWGETQGRKHKYDWDTYGFGGKGDISRYNLADGLTSLQPQDDAATQILCNGWRMPTLAELQELAGKCTWTWKPAGAVGPLAGYHVAGPNGNSIFLPAAGYHEDYFGDALKADNQVLHYWSADLATGSFNEAQSLFFNANSMREPEFEANGRCDGFSIRPVCPR